MKKIYLNLMMLFLLLISIKSSAQWSVLNLANGYGNPAAASAGGKAVFAGGEDDYFNSAMSNPWYYMYDSVTGSVTNGNISVARAQLAGASTGNIMMFAGGYDDWTQTLYWDVDIYNAGSNQWSTSQLSVKRQNLAGAAYGSKILFAGGWNSVTNTIYNTVDIYDTLTGTWITASLSSARYNLCAAAANGKIVFAGGRNATTAVNTVDIYNVATGTWSTATLSEPKTEATAIACGNKIYIAGGFNPFLGSTRIDVYNTTTNSWSIDTLSIGRGRLCAATDGRFICFAGGVGMVANQFYYDDVDILDTYTGNKTVDHLAHIRFDAAATSVGNSMLFAEGFNDLGVGVPSIEKLEINTSGFISHSGNSTSLRVYPQPASNYIILNLSKPLLTSQHLYLYDINCKRIDNEYSLNRNAGTLSSTIDVTNLENGIYFLRSEDGNISSPVIVSH